MLLAAEIDGERLSDLEFDLFFLLLINAGGDTTRNLVASGMLTLLQHPEQLAALRRDRRLLPGAIEEMLRWCTPVMQFRRTATRDAEIRGQQIAKGQKVVMFYPSANRDEEVFAEPDRFDVRRAPNPHVAFGGGGAHFCLGASLARLEIRCLFDAILARLARRRARRPGRAPPLLVHRRAPAHAGALPGSVAERRVDDVREGLARAQAAQVLDEGLDQEIEGARHAPRDVGGETHARVRVEPVPGGQRLRRSTQSRDASATRPSSSAARSASWSTSSPRETLTRWSPGFTRASAAASTRCRVSRVLGAASTR